MYAIHGKRCCADETLGPLHVHSVWLALPGTSNEESVFILLKNPIVRGYFGSPTRSKARRAPTPAKERQCAQVAYCGHTGVTAEGVRMRDLVHETALIQRRRRLPLPFARGPAAELVVAGLLADPLPRGVFGLRLRALLVRGTDAAAVVMTIVPLETPKGATLGFPRPCCTA